MFLNVVTYCPQCRAFTRLTEHGECPACTASCAAYPAFSATARQYEIIVENLCRRCDISLGTVRFRGEVEGGCWWGDVHNAFRGLDEPELKFLEPDIASLPKLDVVAQTVRHAAGQEIVIHMNPYVPPFYGMKEGRYVSVEEILGPSLMAPIFPAKKDGAAVLGYEFVPAVSSLFARNRLWYAALAQGFYLFPDDADRLPYFADL